MTEPLPPQERLHELLAYCMGSGEFRWRNPKARNLKPGQLAGRWSSRGRCQIYVDGRRYLASRLAWMYVYGEDPGTKQVDHIQEGAKKIDAIWNLQLLNGSQNVTKYHQFIRNDDA